MQRLVFAALLTLALTPRAPAAEEPAARLTSRIAAVTVYADRARVERQADTALAAGVQVCEFTGLPGWIDDASVRLALEPAGAARIADLQVRREYLSQPDSAEVRAAQAAVEEVADQIAALEDEEKVLAAQEKQITDIRAFSLDRMPKDAAVGQLNIATYGDTVKFVADGLRGVAEARRAIQHKRRALEPERNVRALRLNDLQQRGRLEQSTVRVYLDAAAAGRAKLSLVYLLPGATWTPVHELRSATADAATVELATFAVLSQTTGEDWTGAKIGFSTQSTSESIRKPELERLLLGSREAAAHAVGLNVDSFDDARKRFVAQSKGWNAMQANAPVDARELTLNYERQEAEQVRNRSVFETIQQKRGTTTQFNGEGLPVVRSDGRPVRVLIGRARLPAALQLVAAPELSLNAYRMAELTNQGGQPLLPGDVSLFREGAFLGVTDLEFVAAGESCSVTLGVADQVKLSRTLDRRRSRLVRGARTRVEAAFDIVVENLSDAPQSLKLNERVPVSEDRDIRVSGVDIEPDVKPDAGGLVAWQVDLKAREKKSFRVAYTIEYPAAAILEGKPGADSGAPSSLHEQLKDLEQKF